METRVDVRDAATWGHVDRLINRIDGSSGKGMKAAASAPVLGASVNTADPLTVRRSCGRRGLHIAVGCRM